MFCYLIKNKLIDSKSHSKLLVIPRDHYYTFVFFLCKYNNNNNKIVHNRILFYFRKHTNSLVHSSQRFVLLIHTQAYYMADDFVLRRTKDVALLLSIGKKLNRRNYYANYFLL